MELLPPEERSRAVREGFTWDITFVYDRYWIAAGMLYSAGALARDYRPGAYPQMVTDLARLNEGDETAVLRYAEKWGALGFRYLVAGAPKETREQFASLMPGYPFLDLQASPFLDLKSVDQRIAGDELSPSELAGLAPGLSFVDRPNNPPILDADPLRWIWAHAQGVRLCLKLLDYVKSDNLEGLKRYLGTLLEPIPAERDPNHVRFCLSAHVGSSYGTINYCVTPLLYLGGFTPAPWNANPRLVAFELGTKIVNDNLYKNVGIALQLSDDVQGLVIGKRGVMLGHIYWHLARLAVGELGFAQCGECGHYFTQTDKRQHFCPPEPWAGARSESRCAKRARMRRLRANKRKESSSDGEA